MTGSKIDYTDIPELSQPQLKKMRRVGRPPVAEEPRTPISIRIDRTVLAWLKSVAAERDKPYQSLINEILARAMKRASR